MLPRYHEVNRKSWWRRKKCIYFTSSFPFFDCCLL